MLCSGNDTKTHQQQQQQYQQHFAQIAHSISGGMSHPGVSNGFSGDLGLSLSQSLPPMMPNLSSLAGLPGLPGMGSSIPPSMAMMAAGLTNQLSSSATSAALPAPTSGFPHNSLIGDQTSGLHHHVHDNSLSDLKMAGLDTSVSFSYSSAGTTHNQNSSSHRKQSAEELQQESVLHHHQQQQLQQQVADIASLPGFNMTGQERRPDSNVDINRSSSNANVASFTKPKQHTPKNLSSWSSLAQSSVPSTSASSLKTSASVSFAQFKMAAKEKEARVCSFIFVF